MNVPDSVTRALADRDPAGEVCLDAGAGVGNSAAGLLAAGADHVYAVTDRADHARRVRERFADAGESVRERLTVLEADLRSLPLPDGAASFLTAHALFNVLPNDAAAPIARELGRVAAPGATLVVDDYDPLPPEAPLRELFAVENAAAELATGRPALTFHPAAGLTRLFVGDGWTAERERTLSEPVRWRRGHAMAHAAEVRRYARSLPDPVGAPLVAEAERLAVDVGATEAGRLYSVALRRDR